MRDRETKTEWCAWFYCVWFCCVCVCVRVCVAVCGLLVLLCVRFPMPLCVQSHVRQGVRKLRRKRTRFVRPSPKGEKSHFVTSVRQKKRHIWHQTSSPARKSPWLLTSVQFICCRHFVNQNEEEKANRNHICELFSHISAPTQIFNSLFLNLENERI